MTKDVLIHMKSFQFIHGPKEEDNEAVEVLTPGEYYFRNNTHYILYDEILDDGQQPTHNMIKIRPGYMEVRKRGQVNVHMIFEDNKKNVAIYRTPFGNLEMGINATRVLMARNGDNLQIRAEYAMEVNNSEAFDCRMDIRIAPKGEQGGKTFFEKREAE